MRVGWEQPDRYALFDCAPYHGGHSHHDALAIVVYASGRDLLIDPSQIGYDQLLASYFRSGEHELVRQFHLAPGSPALVDKRFVQSTLVGGTNVQVLCADDERLGTVIEMRDGWVSARTPRKTQVIAIAPEIPSDIDTAGQHDHGYALVVRRGPLGNNSNIAR